MNRTIGIGLERAFMKNGLVDLSFHQMVLARKDPLVCQDPIHPDWIQLCATHHF
jgi:hypothetical protein